MFTIGATYWIEMPTEAEFDSTSFGAIVEDYQPPLLKVRKAATGETIVINTAAPTFVSAKLQKEPPSDDLIDDDIPF